MDKIIIELWVPAIDKTFDFEVPGQMRVCDFLEETMAILERSEQNVRFDRRVPLLCDRDHDRILENQARLSDRGIRDAHRLMLL